MLQTLSIRTSLAIGEQMSRIRALGSMLVSAAVASDEYRDWHSVGVTGKMLMDEAEAVQSWLDELEMIDE